MARNIQKRALAPRRSSQPVRTETQWAQDILTINYHEDGLGTPLHLNFFTSSASKRKNQFVNLGIALTENESDIFTKMALAKAGFYLGVVPSTSLKTPTATLFFDRADNSTFLELRAHTEDGIWVVGRAPMTQAQIEDLARWLAPKFDWELAA